MKTEQRVRNITLLIAAVEILFIFIAMEILLDMDIGEYREFSGYSIDYPAYILVMFFLLTGAALIVISLYKKNVYHVFAAFEVLVIVFYVSQLGMNVSAYDRIIVAVELIILLFPHVIYYSFLLIAKFSRTRSKKPRDEE